MIYQLVNFVIVICVLYLLWRVFLKGSDLSPPEISGKLPLIGHGHHFLGGSVGVWKGIKNASEECLKNGGIARMYFGPRTVYVLTDPDVCLALSNICLQKDHIYNFAKPFLGNGLIIGSVPTWKIHRKLLNPAFNQQVLNNFVGVFNSQARRLVDQFNSEVGKPFDHEHLLRLNNLETICITVTGVDSDEFNVALKQYLPCIGEMLKIMTERFGKLWLHNDFIYNFSSLKKRQDEVIKNLLHLSSSIVRQRKKELEKKWLSGENYLEKSQEGKPQTFMDLILDLANKTNCFTDDEIREETDNIVAAGHDTSATHLTFAFLMLGSYPEVQQKVYEEVIRIGGPADRDLDKVDISELVYIDAVLKETLRLYPVAPFIARFIDKDIKLKNYTLKANSGCFFLLYGVHRAHAIWGADASEFKPERWLDPALLPDLNYFGGFGLGRRACIGKVYAMMSMKTIIAHMVRRYRIKSDISNLKLKLDVMLRPDAGHHITLQLRNNNEGMNDKNV